MNRRILKKRCKRAMEVLIAHHGYKYADFSPSDGQESIYAPSGMEARAVKRYGPEPEATGWLHPGPLKGTPLLWRRTSYEYDEWDCELPTEVLADIVFWASLSPGDMADMMQDYADAE